jgi:hypothetical protein
MSDAGQTWRSMGMAETLRDALQIAMRADPTVFLLGEDIGVRGGFGLRSRGVGRRRVTRRSAFATHCRRDLAPRAIGLFKHGWSVRRQEW